MQVRIIISGFVQGVGFRYFLREEAENLGITGWAKNLADGTVEALLQGDETKVRALIELSKNGPIMSQVEKIEEYPANEPTYEDFVVKTN